MCACSAAQSTEYDPATIWLADVKSRLPLANEYVMTENNMPNAAPIRIAAISGNVGDPAVENISSSSPTNSPNHAPDATPAAATRG